MAGEMRQGSQAVSLSNGRGATEPCELDLAHSGALGFLAELNSRWGVTVGRGAAC